MCPKMFALRCSPTTLGTVFVPVAPLPYEFLPFSSIQLFSHSDLLQEGIPGADTRRDPPPTPNTVLPCLSEGDKAIIATFLGLLAAVLIFIATRPPK